MEELLEEKLLEWAVKELVEEKVEELSDGMLKQQEQL